jgi:hypothetical protein
LFWPRFVGQTLMKQMAIGRTIGQLLLARLAIVRDRDARDYLDQSLTPVHDDEATTLDLLTKTAGAGAAVAHAKRMARPTGAVAPAAIA